MLSFFKDSYKELSNVEWSDLRSSFFVLLLVLVSVFLAASFFAFIDFLSFSAIDKLWSIL